MDVQVHQYTSTIRVKDATRTLFERGATHESNGSEAALVEEVTSREALLRARQLIMTIGQYVQSMCDSGQELETLTIIGKLDSRYTLQFMYCLGLEFRAMSVGRSISPEKSGAPSGISSVAVQEHPVVGIIESMTKHAQDARRKPFNPAKDALFDESADNEEETPQVIDSDFCAGCDRAFDSVKNKPRRVPLHVVMDSYSSTNGLLVSEALPDPQTSYLTLLLNPPT